MKQNSNMTFTEWETQIPEDLKMDVVWRIEGYRLSLFLSDACWHDTQLLIDNKRFALADQL